MNLPKAKKRKLTKTKFQEEFLSRKDIKKLHRDRYQPEIKGKQMNYKNCLIHIKLKDNECYINNESDTDE